MSTTFTVFTPTFNRAKTLPRLFSSLLAQSDRDFEWVVIDDGSNDETDSLVKACAREAPFDVRYSRQPNRGKHVAMNTGVQAARGELFLNVDSDDWLLPGSIETLRRHWLDIPPEFLPSYSGVTGLCQQPDGQLIGTRYPRDVLDSNSMETRIRYRVRGDKCGFTRLDVMRHHPFPNPGRDLVPEGVVWNEIGRSYLTRYVNDVVLVKEYRPDGLTRGRRGAGSAGMALYYERLLSTGLPVLVHNPVALARAAASYSWWSTLSGRSLRQQYAALDGPASRAAWFCGLPVGWAKARLQQRPVSA